MIWEFVAVSVAAFLASFWAPFPLDKILAFAAGFTLLYAWRNRK